MNTEKIIRIAISIVAILFLTVAASYGQSFYVNKTSTWLFSDAGQDKQLAWHISNGDSVVEAYTMDSYIMSTSVINGRAKRDWVARWILKCSRKSIKNTFVWSSELSVLRDLDAYQRRQPNDSTRFSLVKSELEPYNDQLSYDEFYRRLIAVYRYAHDNTVKYLIAKTYMGWPKEWTTIHRYSDMIDLHAYVPNSYMYNPLQLYTYTRGRLEQIASAGDILYPNDPNRKELVQIIGSNEPAFCREYYKTHSYNEGFQQYKKGWDQYASSKVKRRILIRQRVNFISGYDTRLYPPSATAAAREAYEEIPKPKLLRAYPDGTVVVIDMNKANAE